MKLLRSSARWLLLALLLPLIPASQAHAGVFISVGFAPPVLPIYVQPVCPTPGLMWTPGYWAYGPDGYFWVPGAWVPAPYMGALWTPPYWGWSGGAYIFHTGYWGPHVGYYGGINYGYGYGGMGFAGGMWRGGVFAYNTAVMHVGSGGGWGGNRVYVDREVVNRTTIVNNNRVAFNGGPNGVRYQASAQERSYMNERHVQATSYQTQHEQSARGDRMAYAKANNGRPQNLVATRPLGQENRPAPGGRPGNESRPAGPITGAPARPGQPNGGARPEGPNTRPVPETRPTQPVTRPAPETRPQPQERPAPQTRPAPETRPAPQRPAPQPQERPAPRPSPETRPAPAPRPAPQTRPAPQERPAPQPHPQQSHPQERPKEPKGR